MEVYPCQATSTEPVSINGFCAVEQTNLPTTWAWYDFGQGPEAIINSISDYKGNSNNYWLWYEGSVATDSAMGWTSLDTHILSTTTKETLLLSFYIAPQTATTSDSTNATSTANTTDQTTSNTQITSGGGVGGGSANQIGASTFDVPKAIAYLTSNENPNGSFGADLYTDWAAIAFGAYGVQNGALKNYISSNILAGDVVTDYERHAMALMALGIDPYSGTSVNYIKKITDSFDGTQIGDPSLYNDDIFALLPLLKAGYTTSDPVISKTVQFIISKQSASGSWDSVDLTSAAIQALSQVQSEPGVSSAISNAQNFLKNSETNGGYNTSYSTSWALQAIATLGQNPSQWQQGSANPLTFLANLQQVDGGVESTTTTTLDGRVWATSYAIPAALGKSWPSIISSFNKPIDQSSSIGGVNTATSTATTTNPINILGSTSTAPLATTSMSIRPNHPKIILQTKPAVLSSLPQVTTSTTEATSSTSLAAVYASAPGQSKNWIFVTIAFTVGLSAVGFGIYRMKS